MDVSDAHLRIGPFSRASLLSIKALRAYHERGILVPAAVDDETGYRVYEASQLLDAAVLKRLRDLDVPLEQIRTVLDARDPAVTERVLTRHAASMQQRLADTARIIDELQRGIDRPSMHTPVHLRDDPHRHALLVDGRVDESNFSTFLDGAFAALMSAYERLVGPMTEPGRSSAAGSRRMSRCWMRFAERSTRKPASTCSAPISSGCSPIRLA